MSATGRERPFGMNCDPRQDMAIANVITLPSRAAGQSCLRSGVLAVRRGVTAQMERPAGTTIADAMTELLVAVRDRQDRAAFAALFRHFAPRVKSYLRRFGDDDGRIDEVLQETFSAVWTKARLFKPDRASASTWIYTIARNQRIDAFRRERRPEFDPEDPAFVPEAEPDGEAALTARERNERVATAMSELNDDQREVLRLSFFEEKSHDAIASKLGLPIGTVKSRIRLAYGHLRARLEAQAGGLL